MQGPATVESTAARLTPVHPTPERPMPARLTQANQTPAFIRTAARSSVTAWTTTATDSSMSQPMVEP
jgi:hypothetical protein